MQVLYQLSYGPIKRGGGPSNANRVYNLMTTLLAVGEQPRGIHIWRHTATSRP